MRHPLVPTVVTLTLAPCLDISSVVDVVEPWHKLRCSSDRLHAGGGGVNVARAVRELGGTAIAVAALGGRVGAIVADQLEAEGVLLHRVRAAGPTRENFAVTERSTGRQFRFVREAPPMARREYQHCLAAVRERMRDAQCVVASGGLPPGVPGDVYVALADEAAALGIPFVLDASGAALRSSLPARAPLVKPSRRELAALVGRALETVEDCAHAAHQVLASSAWHAIVVSLGPNGAVLSIRDAETLHFAAPDVHVVSTIGAGDSMVAGIALATARGAQLPDAVRFGVAAGTAAVMSEGAALCDERDVVRLLPRVAVQPVP